MSLGYVKKKADTRAGKQQIIDEVFNKPSTTKFDDFVNNKELTETTFENVLDDTYYTSQDWYASLKNKPIEKISAEELVKETDTGYKTVAYVELDENNAIIKFKIDPNASKEEIEFNLLHEVRHTQQNPEQIKELGELVKNLDYTDVKSMEAYFNHPLELDADNWAREQINNKKVNYEEKGTTNKTVTDKPEDISSDGRLSDNIRNSSMGKQQADANGRELEQTTRPISERIKETNGDLNHHLEKEANNYASSTINKKKEYTNGKTDRSANAVDINSSTA
ncbi:hypothetical protein IJD15_06620 [bacterium]|nr:hypothetical protein [bacterium]